MANGSLAEAILILLHMIRNTCCTSLGRGRAGRARRDAATVLAGALVPEMRRVTAAENLASVGTMAAAAGECGSGYQALKLGGRPADHYP